MHSRSNVVKQEYDLIHCFNYGIMPSLRLLDLTDKIELW